ncbi:MAG TPA: DUF1127 domain-containing protein [Dongiaceae bacterium]|jgi:uncharacterized protein YjiS (DUF1127 family)
MTDLTTASSVLPRAVRQPAPRTTPAVARPDLIGMFAGILSWFWVQRRRREIIRTLEKVDDHLLRDAGIERGNIEEFVDTLMARWR